MISILCGGTWGPFFDQKVKQQIFRCFNVTVIFSSEKTFLRKVTHPELGHSRSEEFVWLVTAAFSFLALWGILTPFLTKQKHSHKMSDLLKTARKQLFLAIFNSASFYPHELQRL